MSDKVRYAFDASSEAQDASVVAPGPVRRQRIRRREDWRQGGNSVRRWDARLLAVALAGVGVGVVSSVALAAVGAPWSIALSSVALWAGMSAVVIFAFVRSAPAGLLVFRPVDLVWGVAFGVCLRILQGWLTHADSEPFPSALALDGVVPTDWWLSSALPAGLVAPIVEEFFFRVVILVVVYQLLRRSLGSLAAGVTSALVSAGAFVLLHAAFTPVGLPAGVQLFVLGLTVAGLVLLTGRIWSAVIVHVVYNCTLLALVLLGSIL